MTEVGPRQGRTSGPIETHHAGFRFPDTADQLCQRRPLPGGRRPDDPQPGASRQLEADPFQGRLLAARRNVNQPLDAQLADRLRQLDAAFGTGVLFNQDVDALDRQTGICSTPRQAPIIVSSGANPRADRIFAATIAPMVTSSWMT